MDLSIYKVDLDTDQPNGGKGESPRSAFTKYNNSLDTINDELTALGENVGTINDELTTLDDSAMKKADNLSDLSDVEASRSNLGLKDGATLDVATQAQAEALTGSTTLITPERLGNAMSKHVLGVGQTWQDVAASRQFNTTYTNTTGRAIVVQVSGWTDDETDYSNLYLVVDGVGVSEVRTGWQWITLTVSGIVPAGSTYRVNNGNAWGLSTWVELR